MIQFNSIHFRQGKHSAHLPCSRQAAYIVIKLGGFSTALLTLSNREATRAVATFTMWQSFSVTPPLTVAISYLHPCYFFSMPKGSKRLENPILKVLKVLNQRETVNGGEMPSALFSWWYPFPLSLAQVANIPDLCLQIRTCRFPFRCFHWAFVHL